MSDQPILRFGAFELHLSEGELRHQGDLIKLPPQPFKVLEFLARRSGQIVTRAQIREHIWCGDTFVDFEQGLNFCIRQIRGALGDGADAPRFIETLPRRGYRFLLPVQTVGSVAAGARVTRLIVLPFRMLRPDAETEFLAFSLPDALASSLGGLESLVVRSTMAASRLPTDADPKTIGSAADVDVIVSGTLLRAGGQLRVATQLTDAANGALLWSETFQTAVGDVFGVQDDLARRVVASLKLRLTGREQQVLRRDVPASGRAYDFFLRGNQLSYDPKQYGTARDLYARAIEEDPRFAPAWARMGRIHHVMAKYVAGGSPDGFTEAEVAFQQALELNPDSTLTHKLYAQLEVDLGRALAALTRLVERARTADPELLAGLVSTCRYCGLLDASVAAHARAVALEPKIRTSVPHTWFLQRDHARVATISVADFPYIVPLSLAELGRGNEALPVLRELEQTMRTRVPGFVIAARTLLEGKNTESIATVARIVASGFKDPEGLYYLSRHLAHLREVGPALALFERVVAGGFLCYPAMVGDPWLASMRKKPVFAKLLRKAETQHLAAAKAFAALHGETLLA